MKPQMVIFSLSNYILERKTLLAFEEPIDLSVKMETICFFLGLRV